MSNIVDSSDNKNCSVMTMDYAKVVMMEALKLKPVKEENIRDVFLGRFLPFLNFSVMPSSAERI